MTKCYYPDWENPGHYEAGTHSWNKDGDCTTCGEPMLKPLNSLIQICPRCGKVDVYRGDNHDCFLSAQNSFNTNEEYK